MQPRQPHQVLKCPNAISSLWLASDISVFLFLSVSTRDTRKCRNDRTATIVSKPPQVVVISYVSWMHSKDRECNVQKQWEKMKVILQHITQKTKSLATRKPQEFLGELKGRNFLYL